MQKFKHNPQIQEKLKEFAEKKIYGKIIITYKNGVPTLINYEYTELIVEKEKEKASD